MNTSDLNRFDVAIIGSGVSGGRLALDLTRGGARCVLIEAGQAFDAGEFPLSEFKAAGALFWGGGLEMSHDGRLGFLRARCVGGTSIVNQALMDRFDDSAFGDWRIRSGIYNFNENYFGPLYDAVLADIKTHRMTAKHFNRNAQIFTTAFDHEGYQWEPLLRAQSDCGSDPGSDCIVCLNGCPRKSKQSTWVTLIPEAIRLGLKLESGCEIGRIEELSGGGVKLRGRQKGREVSFLAEKVFLAAGALGNSKLLLQSGFGADLPALGNGFSCHPQYMSYGYFSDPVDAHKGAFQTVKSKDPKLRARGYKFENVFAQPIGTAMLMPGSGVKHLKLMKHYRHFASIEVCIRDEALGSLQVARDGRLKILKPLSSIDHGKIREGRELIESLFWSAGAKEVVNCPQGFGLHLMGGCTIGESAKTSVVNPDFQVHGHRRLYAADSSVFPSAPGINPSLTIFALSHWAAQKFLGTPRGAA